MARRGRSILSGFLTVGFNVFLLSFTACDTRDTPNNRNSVNVATNMNASAETKKDEVSENIDDLARRINLPVRPVAAKWSAKVLGKENSTAPGPTDYALTAVLQFDEAGAGELVRRLDEKPAEKKSDSIEVEEWFPEETKKAAQERDGAAVVTGPNYRPDAFLRSPYSGGKVVRVGESNYFVVKILSF